MGILKLIFSWSRCYEVKDLRRVLSWWPRTVPFSPSVLGWHGNLFEFGKNPRGLHWFLLHIIQYIPWYRGHIEGTLEFMAPFQWIQGDAVALSLIICLTDLIEWCLSLIRGHLYDQSWHRTLKQALERELLFLPWITRILCPDFHVRLECPCFPPPHSKWPYSLPIP